MAVTLPNGTTFFIASGYGASKAMSAVSNANPGEATLEASHGVVAGDFLEVTSGWSRLTDKVVRAGTVDVNDVELAGIDTTLTSIYPAGSGIGTVREVTGWTELQQILTSTSSGGEQQFATYRFLSADQDTRIPTSKSPSGLEFSVADDPTLPGFILASAANDDRVPRAVKAVLPNGSIILYNGYISVNKTPSFNADAPMACQVTISFKNEPVRYSA